MLASTSCEVGINHPSSHKKGKEFIQQARIEYLLLSIN